MTEGWYTRIISKQFSKIRWITIGDFWINIYNCKKDKTPVMALHTSNLEITDSTDEISNAHSFKVLINHNCAQKSVIISTPNQFDIVEIKERLQKEIAAWNEYALSTVPKLPQQFVMDNTGKFVYRNIDRLHVSIIEDGIEIKQESKDDIKILANSTFDVYPTLETESDPRWVAITSNTGSYHLHCQTFEDAKQFVNLSLHFYRRLSDKKT
ncbi:hypothetical protein TVAG_006420 [Trichomonas vaginalis G3]|uniref:PH domain-containing protein n=1 Tax=Trichomonas vaginalis (strain ATCC PRA-98 / G3) TaxID=412133 RepID=A2E749_TRIV3|nr:hypothetical protein TVAGG3_0982960 [Trichomonas vaginalis G3]EAY11567.1 hypothetical protein TVAG_006420 [Trichomonas vaginalis G3]KAI5489451.1 hypothetical protein TVAGG3_0982960 [Trichomonas vaginalis G3]|eukprot:XP_001323790.1 hypothetical protein [Trichomonas vaginalis G3]